MKVSLCLFTVTVTIINNNRSSLSDRVVAHYAVNQWQVIKLFELAGEINSFNCKNLDTFVLENENDWRRNTIVQNGIKCIPIHQKWLLRIDKPIFTAHNLQEMFLCVIMFDRMAMHKELLYKRNITYLSITFAQILTDLALKTKMN